MWQSRSLPQWIRKCQGGSSLPLNSAIDPESRKMHKPPYTNSSDRQSADPESQFKATSFHINLRNWPAECWRENMTPEVPAFQSTVDSFGQWGQLINYLAWLMMGCQKLSLNCYSAAELTLIMNAASWFGRTVAHRQQGHFPCPIYIHFSIIHFASDSGIHRSKSQPKVSPTS